MSLVIVSVDNGLRRTLDVIVAATVLLLLAPLFVSLAVLVKLSSRGPVLFVQQRIGRGGAPFGLLKFRTMVSDAAAPGSKLTVGADPRITPIGAILRRCKLDELPQFANVLRGDMSLVGPRPEVPEYVALYSEEQRRVFAVRPGITDPASLTYHDEASLLATFDDPERAYRERVLPHKLAISLEYLARRTVASDLSVIAETALRMVVSPKRFPNATPEPEASAPPAPEPPREENVAGDGLRAQVVSGAWWSAGSYYANTVLRLAISIGLARLLSPAEFGLMALATTVLGLVSMVQESGLSTALIQYRGRIAPAATTALFLMTSSGILLAATTWLAAPLISGYLGYAELTDMLRTLAVLFVVHGLANTPRAILQRSMLFKRLAVIQLAATALYGIAGVSLAAWGTGVWSLVWAYLASEILSGMGAWAACPWRPDRREFDWKTGRELARFGRHILGANLFDLLRERVPILIIGKVLGADEVGYYWMSVRWASLPTEGITWVIAKVSFPFFVRVRDDADRFRDGYRRTLDLILVLAIPAAVGIALVAEPLIQTLYDARWSGAVAPLQILAFYGLFLAIAASTGAVFNTAGKSQYVFVYSAIYTAILGALLIGLGFSHGLTGIALATVVAPALIAVAAVFSACRILQLNPRTLLRLFVTPVAATCGLTAAVVIVSHAASNVGARPWSQLLCEVFAGAVAYLTLLAVVQPARLRDFLSLVGWRSDAPYRLMGKR